MKPKFEVSHVGTHPRAKFVFLIGFGNALPNHAIRENGNTMGVNSFHYLNNWSIYISDFYMCSNYEAKVLETHHVRHKTCYLYVHNSRTKEFMWEQQNYGHMTLLATSYEVLQACLTHKNDIDPKNTILKWHHFARPIFFAIELPWVFDYNG